MKNKGAILIRDYRAADAHEVADVFFASVHGISEAHYSLQQKIVWASKPDYELWRERLMTQKPYLAIIHDKVAGFIELEANGYINCFYVHPDFQNKGVGIALYHYAEHKAFEQAIPLLTVHASIVAYSFFTHRGFRLIHPNLVERNGVTLKNYFMEKRLYKQQDMNEK